MELALKCICVRNQQMKSWIQGENNHKSTADNCSQEEMTSQIASGDSLVKHGHWNLWKKQATHKPSSKAAFFLSAWTNRWALHHPPSRHKDWLCEHMAVCKWGFQKEGLSAEKGWALPEDTTRSQKILIEVQNMSRIRTHDTGKCMVSLGKQWQTI